MYATGGQLSINDPHATSVNLAPVFKGGTHDLAVARLGWKWAISPKILLDARGAFVRTSSDYDVIVNSERRLDREWSLGTNVSWSWRHGAVLQGGYTLRRPHVNFSELIRQPPPPFFFGTRVSDVRQDFYAQNSVQLWRDRIRLQGGLRRNKLNTAKGQPITGQFSASYRAATNTTLEAGWGRYGQLPARGGIAGGFQTSAGEVLFGYPPYMSSQYIVAVEQRIGERTRFRIEAFDRQNESHIDFFTQQGPPGQQVTTPLALSALSARDHSRGLQILLQRRSENRLSGWIGYTFLQARSRSYQITLPLPFSIATMDSPYAPTQSDQPHTVNIFGTYRLTPSIRLSAKALYGSGFPVIGVTPPLRIGPYQRLDLRADKSWTFKRWKLSLYTELLNATGHNNRRFEAYAMDPATHQTFLYTNPGFPTLPTAGLGFDF